VVGEELTDRTNNPNKTENKGVEEAGAAMETVAFTYYGCNDDERDVDTEFHDRHPASSIEVYHGGEMAGFAALGIVVR
jgi:hypothetical protein